MNLKVLLPFQIFSEKTGVTRIVAETPDGSFGLPPQRLDCVAALAPGILIYESETDGEVFVAVDEGVLVGAGAVGLVLGAVFFGGLWWTVRKGVASPRPALWFVGSMLLRTGVVLAGFYSKPSRLKSASDSKPRRIWSAGSNSPRMARRWRGASRTTSRHWNRASANSSRQKRQSKPEAKAEPTPMAGFGS